MDLFAQNLNLKLEVDTVKRSCLNGKRRSIAYYRVQRSIYGGNFPHPSPEYAKVGANDTKNMEARPDFTTHRAHSHFVKVKDVK